MKTKGTHRVRTVTKDDLEQINILFLYDPRQGLASQVKYPLLSERSPLTTAASVVNLLDDLKPVARAFGLSFSRLGAIFGLSNGYLSATKVYFNDAKNQGQPSPNVHEVTSIRLRALRSKVNELITLHNEEVERLFPAPAPEPEPEPVEVVGEPVVPLVGQAELLTDVAQIRAYTYLVRSDGLEVLEQLKQLNQNMSRLIEIWGMTPAKDGE